MPIRSFERITQIKYFLRGVFLYVSLLFFALNFKNFSDFRNFSKIRIKKIISKKNNNILLNLFNKIVEVDFDYNFLINSEIRKQIWRFKAKNKNDASKAPHQQKWDSFFYHQKSEPFSLVVHEVCDEF